MQSSNEPFLRLDRAICRVYLFLGGEFVRDAELVELFGIDGRRGFGHEIGGFIRLWEGDDVAQRVGACEQHDHAVEPERQAAVWRGAEREGVEEEAEFGASFFVADAECAEDFLLNVYIMDTDRAAAQFDAVEDEVVGLCVDLPEIAAFEGGPIAGAWARERVMHGVPAVIFIAPLEHGEIGDPCETDVFGFRHCLWNPIVFDGDFFSDAPQGVSSDVEFIGDEEERGAVFGLHLIDERRFFGVGEVFGDAGIELTVGDFCPGEYFSAVCLGDVGEALFDVFSAHLDRGRDADGANRALFLFERLCEEFELSVAEDFGDVVEEHAESDIGGIDAVEVHGIVPRDALERARQIDIEDFFEDRANHFFANVLYIFGLDKAHFDVDLCKFGLAIESQIFVAEASSDLVIAVESRHHIELFEELWRLGQSIESPGLDAARDQVIACAFGRRFAEDWRLEVEKIFRFEHATNNARHFATRNNIVVEAWATQIEVSIFEADFFVGIAFVVDGKWRRFGAVKYAQFFSFDFDFARCQLFIGVFAARNDFAFDADTPFGADLLRLLEQRARRIDMDLRDAVSVAQNDKQKTAQIAIILNPTDEADGLADIATAKCAACMRALKSIQKFTHCSLLLYNARA